MKKMSMLLVVLFLVTVSCSDDDDKAQESSIKKITAFTFLASDHDALSADVKGVVNESAKTIKAKLPEGTSLTELKPTIAISEDAKVSPTSKAVKNFSNPIIYTVTAEDESTSKYTVTITVEED